MAVHKSTKQTGNSDAFPISFKNSGMAYPRYTLFFLPIIKHTKNLHASVSTNISLPSRLVTCRHWRRLHSIHLRSLATAAPSCRCFARHRGAALYGTAHHHGSCAAARAGHEESVGSCRDSMYILPSTEHYYMSDGADFSS